MQHGEHTKLMSIQAGVSTYSTRNPIYLFIIAGMAMLEVDVYLQLYKEPHHHNLKVPW